MKRRGIKTVIPTQSIAKRQIALDRAAYTERNRTERLINRLKQYRRVTARHEKRADTYATFPTLVAIRCWLWKQGQTGLCIHSLDWHPGPIESKRAATLDRILTFPQDDRLWWVRWVDHVELPAAGTDSPGLFVLLSPLPEGADPDDGRRFETEAGVCAPGTGVCRVLAGTAPALAIGAVFRNGLRVGRLVARTERFTFHAESTTAVVAPVHADRVVPPPGWWAPGSAYKVLPPVRYPVPAFGGSRCLVLHDGTRSLVVPCFEVFRALYAPHQDIALALVSGPWGETLTRVANPAHTRVRNDGSWQIGLRRRIGNRYAALLANLIVNPAGREAADGIYTALLQHRQSPFRPHFLAVPPPDGPEPHDPRPESPRVRPITAGLPFGWDELRLEARCLLLHGGPAKHFGFEIVGVRWPAPPHSAAEVHYYRDNGAGAGGTVLHAPHPKPYAAQELELAEDAEGAVAVVADSDPNALPQPVAFTAPGALWADTPPLREMPKLESYAYDGPPRVSDDGATASEASAGNPGGSASLPGRAMYEATPRPEGAARFARFAEALTRLRENSDIEGWMVVRPPHSGVEFRDGMVGWPLSKRSDLKRSWRMMDVPERRPRCALLCEVRVAGGAAVHCFELETRGGTAEAYRTVLFRAGPDGLLAVAQALVSLAVEGSGVWPARDKLSATIGAPAATWRHRHDGDAKSRLKAESLLGALRAIAARP